MLKQIEVLQQFSNDDKFSLLIRHSNRYDIPAGTDGSEALLTEQGKINACQLGEKLSAYTVNKIVTTPVKRCIETAEYIAKGYGNKVEIEPSNTFGGLHVYDWQLAYDFLNNSGYEEWYRRIISDISVQGINDAKQYEKLMTDFIVENTKEKGITIFVSYDFLIAFYHYALNKTKYTMFSDWVNYLSGLILKNGKYVARFQNN